MRIHNPIPKPQTPNQEAKLPREGDGPASGEGSKVDEGQKWPDGQRWTPVEGAMGDQRRAVSLSLSLFITLKPRVQ